MVVERGRWTDGRRWVVVLALASLALVVGCSAKQARGRWNGEPVPDGHFEWPAEGRITSLFGPRKYRKALHDGIDIAAPEGSPVRCAAPGVVLYSGVLRGYGRVVIVGHDYGLSSVYAHNREVFVRTGARVRRGSVIASVGRTGRATGPNLHFEIRRENVALDPLRYLPRRAPAVIAGKRPLQIGG